MANLTKSPGDYGSLLLDIKQRVRTAQYEALKAVNKELIGLYWDIGHLLSDRRAGTHWGKAVVSQLAADLQAEFPGIGGFSASNLWRMKLFYETYAQNEKLAPLVREIGWTHNLIILEKCRDHAEREFYLRMTRKFGWTKNVLSHQIANQTYEKALRSQTNFDQTLPAEVRDHAKLAVRDEYTFDFLELADEHTEKQLEAAILSRVEPFLREMGGLFAFVGSQYRLEIEGREFFIDLLLFHRRLQCLVAIEIKVGEFQPEYVGKMQFYLAALDDRVRETGENASIGILLCRSKNRTIVEYALRDSKRPIGVATYHLVESVPVELRGQLPEPEQVARLLSGID